MKTPPNNQQILDPIQTKNRNRNKVLTTAPLIERGMTLEECRALCTSPLVPLLERTFFRVIYETQLRPMEAQHIRIEQCDKYAKLLSIQKTRAWSEDGRELPLITLMAIRKAGERHFDANGGDRAISAQLAGHTMKTKNQYYAGEQDWGAAHTSYQKYHPAFVEGW